jgi:20S proteasome alpha/beta subunit
MTICIAAIAEKKYVVMAADRTLTMQLEPVEFNHEHSSKLYDVEPAVLIGTSGSPLYIPALLRHIQSISGGSPDYMNRVSKAFFTLRREEMENSIFRRFGWDYAAYEKHFTEGNLLEAHARKIVEEMDSFHVCLHILAGTVMPNGEASISVIEDPEGASCLDAIGFAAVGSGDAYADQVLIRASYTSEMSLPNAIYHIFEAKKMAEQAFGVGRKTDIRIASIGKITHLTDEEVTQLGRLYEEKNKEQAATLGRTLEQVGSALAGSLASLERGRAT